MISLSIVKTKLTNVTSIKINVRGNLKGTMAGPGLSTPDNVPVRLFIIFSESHFVNIMLKSTNFAVRPFVRGS